jgi:hypothetical protein
MALPKMISFGMNIWKLSMVTKLKIIVLQIGAEKQLRFRKKLMEIG